MRLLREVGKQWKRTKACQEAGAREREEGKCQGNMVKTMTHKKPGFHSCTPHMQAEHLTQVT